MNAGTRDVERPALAEEATSFLNGFGQIMLQESALTGVLFLVGIGINSGWMALGGVAGALAGMATARVCGFASTDIARGLYGFNGALVGIAMLYFHAPGLYSVLLLLLGAALSTVVMRAMLRWTDGPPPFTAPFIVATWAMLAVATTLGVVPGSPPGAPGPGGDIVAVLRGLGQVMFQDSWVTGIILAVALAVHSRPAAAWAVIGSAIGLVTARGLGYPPDLAAAGVFGFNAALAAIALGSTFPGNAMMPLTGAVLSTVIARWFQLAGAPALTAPFVLSAWVVVAFGRWRPAQREQSRHKEERP